MAKTKVTHEIVHKILKDAPVEHHFKVNDGTIVKNLHGLYSKLKIMDDKTFMHHVNDTKNDFYNWIFHIIKDEHLAKKLSKIKSKEEMVAIINERLTEFDDVQKKHMKIDEDLKSSQLEEIKRESERLLQDIKEIEDIESMAAGKPATYSSKFDTSLWLKTGMADFMQGIIVGVIIGIILARIIG